MLRPEEHDEDVRAVFEPMLSQRAWRAKHRAQGDRMTRLLKSQDAARLFELMGVNIPLLLLCVPIDYMHQLAVQHQQLGGDPPSRATSISRARRSKKLKTVLSQGRCAKSRAAADLAATSEPLLTAGQQPVLEALSGSATIHQAFLGIRALVSKEDLERQTRWASELPWQGAAEGRKCYDLSLDVIRL
eukprot:gene17119-20354_t